MTMNKKINLNQCFDKFSDTFSPKIVGNVNSQHVLVVKLEGDKVPWHTHENEDEMFLVVDGVLDIFLREETITLRSGEFFIVPKGTEHRVVPRDQVKLILIEPETISHTGDVESEITKSSYESLIQ